MFLDWLCGEHGKRRELTLYNAGSQEIPPYGACEIDDGDRPDAGGLITPGGGRTRFHVKRPTEASLDSGKVLFNGPVAIGAGKEGPGFNDFPTYALYGGEGVPEVGDECGTQADSFELATGNTGFRVCGDIDEGTMLVKPAGGAVNTAYLKILGESEVSENGDPVEPSSKCVYSAEICALNTTASFCSSSTDPWEGTGQLVWVVATDLTRPRSLVVNDRYLGFNAGSFDPDPEGEGSDSRPLYAVRVDPAGFPTFFHTPAKDAYSVYGVNATPLERNNGYTAMRLYNPGGPASTGDRLYATNLAPISQTGDGYATIAGDRPVRMLINSVHGILSNNHGAAVGTPFGCMPGSFSLSPGLPGMMYVGGYDSATNTGYFVRGNHCLFWGKVKSATKLFSSHYYGYANGQRKMLLKVNPAVSLPSGGVVYVYDGTQSAFPNVELDVYVYYEESELPTIFVGDFIQYTYSNLVLSSEKLQTMPGAYMGPPAGTVRIMRRMDLNGSLIQYAPRGWAIMDGTANSTANGGSGVDMRERFPMGLANMNISYTVNQNYTGGSEEHSHSVTGTSGNIQTTTGGGSISDTSHIPPYGAFFFIERIDHY